MACLAGLPGKIGSHGSEVQGRYERGEIDQVAGYCECDVLNLYGLYLRWSFITGKIDRESYENALDDLSSFLEGNAGEKPHCGEFLDKWTREQKTSSEDRLSVLQA